MTDLEAAGFYVRQHDQRNEQRKAEGLSEYGEPSHVTFARALIAVTAERDKLRAVLEAVQKVTGKYGGQMSDLFGQDEEFNDTFDMVDAVLAELKQQ